MVAGNASMIRLLGFDREIQKTGDFLPLDGGMKALFMQLRRIP
jgi:hypothetical protein